MKTFLTCIAQVAWLSQSIDAFSVASAIPTTSARSTTRLFESESEAIAVTLEKPLGMILEEVEEGEPKGVYVLELAEEGSAVTAPYALQGLVVSKVSGQDCTTLAFDDVMEKLIEAPSPVELEFMGAEAEDMFPVGTAVQIKVLEEGDKETVIDAKVGDNLRQTLLDNQIEVYKGLKKKLGNCGGGGQCTFCAADFVESEGWAERSEYEDNKLKKFPNARLSCLNNIQGPATIKI